MLRKMLALSLCILLLLSGCGKKSQKYQNTYWGVFDTATQITGYALTQAEFDRQAQQVFDQLYEYHQLFDIYNDYPGLNNLKTVNDQAGITPVQVAPAIVELLLDCRAYYEATDGVVNVAMGSVLRLWHQARMAAREDPENAALPDQLALQEAAKHTDWESVIIDAQASTVYLSDPAMSLDVGAVAKGWATQKVAEAAPEHMLLSVGGNICATGPKPDGNAWNIGIQDPDDTQSYLQTVNLFSGCAVTSGDYQRRYTVDGVDYHHIIDPQTLYPATAWQSVTVLCADGGLADVLSTALFLLPLEEGKALALSYQAEAMWVDAQGYIYKTDGFDGGN